MKQVTDPKILALLNAPDQANQNVPSQAGLRPVTDSNLLAQLNAPNAAPPQPTMQQQPDFSNAAKAAGAQSNAAGMLSPGNIDLTKRPIVKNPDGTISTVRSMSFNEDGKEILIPTVSPDGRIMEENEAIDFYHKTGQKLGDFDTPENATSYANNLHNSQASFYGADQQQPKGFNPEYGKRALEEANKIKSPYDSFDEYDKQMKSALLSAVPKVAYEAMQGITANFGEDALARVGAAVQHPIDAIKSQFHSEEPNLTSLVTGKNPQNSYEATRDQYLQGLHDYQKNIETENPGAATLAQFSGGLLTAGLGGAFGAAGKAAKAAQAVELGEALNNVKQAGGFLNTAKNVVLGTAKNAAKGYTAAAVNGFGEGEGGFDNRVEKANSAGELGAILSGGIPLLGKTLKAGGGLVVPKLSKGSQAVAELAQKYNIPLGLDQITGSKSRQFLTSTTERIPFSGANKLADSQQGAFNREVLKTIGVHDADKVSEDVVDGAIKTIGKKFDDVLSGKTIDVTPEHTQGLQNIVDDASLALAADKHKAVQQAANKVMENVDANGQISGEKIGNIRSNLTKIAKTADPGIKQYLDDIIDHVVNMSTDGNPEAKSLLNEARFQWKNLRTLEPLLAKASDGNISPALLKNRVINKFGGLNLARGNAGELGDLAKVGDLIKSKVGDSGTAERALGYSAILGGPGMIMGGPVSALGSILGGVGGSAAYQAYNRSQPLVNAVIRNASKAPGNTSKLAQLLGSPITTGTVAGMMNK